MLMNKIVDYVKSKGKSIMGIAFFDFGILFIRLFYL